MKMSRRRSLALLSLVALALASILLFLYLKSSSDQTSTYTESRDVIARMKQLNAQWETEILKARVAISHNYDPLVSPITEMTELWQRFDSMESNHGRNDSPAWNTSHDAYLAAIGEKPAWWNSSSRITRCCAIPWRSCPPPRTTSSNP